MEKRNFIKQSGYDSEAYTEDGKVWKWSSNDRPCPMDACEEYGIPVYREAQQNAINESNEAFFADYKKQMENYVPTAEDLFEMKSAFGEGATVVNVITGKTIKL